MPADAKSKDLFYLCPLEKVKNEEACWYYSAPIGRNKLSKMVSEMCKLAEIPGHHTNHSWRSRAHQSSPLWLPVATLYGFYCTFICK